MAGQEKRSLTNSLPASPRCRRCSLSCRAAWSASLRSLGFSGVTQPARAASISRAQVDLGAHQHRHAASQRFDNTQTEVLLM